MDRAAHRAPGGGSLQNQLMSDELRTLDCPSRRGLLRGLAAVGVTTIAAGVLVACGSDDSGTAGATGSDGAAGSDPTTGPDGAAGSDGTTGADDDGSTAGSDDAGGSGGGADEASIALSEVPVGEAVVVAALGTRLVVAQPTAGEVVAFSAACTHAGTEVVPDGGLELRCPNHGSRFDAGDGAAVLNGPASAPLPEVQARVEGDLILLSA